MRSIIVIGAGGHSRVLIDTLLSYSDHFILGITDKNHEPASEILGINVIGNDDAILEYLPEQIYLVNGLGFLPKLTARQKIYSYFSNKDYEFLSVIHPSAITSSNIHFGEGIQLMAGCIIQTGAYIGDNVIVNTKASVDHDCCIGKNSHIAPGATLCGHVSLGENVFVGAGATIMPGVHIGANAVVAAGAVVLEDVNENDLVVGVPARSYYNENMVGSHGFGRC